MKKYLFLIATAIVLGFTSCNDDNADDPSKGPKTVVGNWYNEEYNEEDRFAPSGTFYTKFCNTNRSEENEGRWEFDAKNFKLTWTYSFMGQTQFADWTVKKLTDYAMVIYSDKSGELSYGKIVETYQMQVGDTKQITFAQTTGNTAVSYTSLNPRLASVQSDGTIKAEGEKGTTYIKVATSDFTAWAKVVVGDECLDLWYDYQSLMGTDLANVKKILGPWDSNGDDGYSYIYVLPDNNYLDKAFVYLNQQSGNVQNIILAMNSTMPESEALTYLKTHYYEAPTIGDNYYTTCPDVENSAAVIYHDKGNKCVYFMTPTKYSLPDYTSDFGLKNADIVKKYGDPFLGLEGYYTLDNYYANMVAFTYDATTSKVTAYRLVINDNVPDETVKALLAKKYKFFKEDNGTFAYIDADTKDEANIGIIYNPKNKILTVLEFS